MTKMVETQVAGKKHKIWWLMCIKTRANKIEEICTGSSDQKRTETNNLMMNRWRIQPNFKQQPIITNPKRDAVGTALDAGYQILKKNVVAVCSTWGSSANSVPSNQITKPTVPAPSWETSSSRASRETPRILWNTKVHCRLHNSPSLVPVLNKAQIIKYYSFSLNSQSCKI